MGCGKTSAYNYLNQYYNAFDLDEIIEKILSKKIHQIFEIHGEQFFREIEVFILSNLIIYDNLIISMGGGTLANFKDTKYLERQCKIIFLHAPISLLWERTKNSNRPKIMDYEYFNNLYFQRLGKYLTFSDMIIDSSEKIWKIKLKKYAELFIHKENHDENFLQKIFNEVSEKLNSETWFKQIINAKK